MTDSIEGIAIQAYDTGKAYYSEFDTQQGWCRADDKIQALRNVAESVMRHTETVKPHNGKGRTATYVGSTEQVAQSARQLAEMVLGLLEGKPLPAIDDDSPF
jgi:hypothetical protein